jgi:hypothetical protein
MALTLRVFNGDRDTYASPLSLGDIIRGNEAVNVKAP